MIVRDILTMKGNAVFSIAPADRVAAGIAAMVEHDVGSLVVMDSDTMVGLLTFREILRALAAAGTDARALTVADIMVREPQCAGPDDALDHLREIMTRNHVRYLPVIENGALLGIISFHDIAHAVIRETASENRLLKRYIEDRPENGDSR
jgi:CBS domain-containing protein